MSVRITHIDPEAMIRKLKEKVSRLEKAQRKPLTDEEIDALREKHSEGRGAGWRFDFKGFARAIEAKLKEKNNG